MAAKMDKLPYKEIRGGPGSQRGQPPISIEMEYRHVVTAVTRGLKLVRAIRARSKESDPQVPLDKMVIAMRDLFDKWEVKEENIRTWGQLDEVFIKYDISGYARKKKEIKAAFCLRGKAGVNTDLKDTVKRLRSIAEDHLQRYCISLKEFCGAFIIKAVNNHDEHLTTLQKELTSQLNEADKAVKRLQPEESKSVIETITEIRDQQGKYDPVCDVIMRVCGTMRRWVDAERFYPKTLWDGITATERSRVLLKDEIRRAELQTREVQHKIERKQYAQGKLLTRLEASRKEKRRLKSSFRTVAELTERGTAALDEANQELELATQLRAQKLQAVKQGQGAFVEAKLEEARRGLEKAVNRLENIMKQRVRLERELKQVSDRTYELDVQHRASDVILHSLRKKYDQIRLVTLQKQKALDQRQHLIMTLKRIRDKKLSADTLKAIYHNKPSEDYHTDPLSVALKITSENVGADWRKVYEMLPFSVPRSRELKLQDIQDIDARTFDITDEVRAMRVFTKWRIVNRGGTLKELITGLRRAHLGDLAQRIEQQFMKQPTAKEPEEMPPLPSIDEILNSGKHQRQQESPKMSPKHQAKHGKEPGSSRREPKQTSPKLLPKRQAKAEKETGSPKHQPKPENNYGSPNHQGKQESHKVSPKHQIKAEKATGSPKHQLKGQGATGSPKYQAKGEKQAGSPHEVKTGDKESGSPTNQPTKESPKTSPKHQPKSDKAATSPKHLAKLDSSPKHQSTVDTKTSSPKRQPKSITVVSSPKHQVKSEQMSPKSPKKLLTPALSPKHTVGVTA